MRAKEREVDRLLTKLEGIACTTSQHVLVLVLPDWLARVVRLAGYRIGQQNYCKDGLFWHKITVRGVQ